MKNKIIPYILISVGLLVSSCVKQEEMGGGPAPSPNTLTSDISAGTSVVLVQTNATNKFATLSWTAIDFGTKTVKYSIELDKAGNNFAHAKDVFTTSELSTTLTVEAINAALISYGIEPDQTVEMEIRIRSWVDYLITPGLSNSLKFTLTPYLLTFPPLYIIGDAQAWTLGNAAALTSHTPGVYTGKAKFVKNGKFRFFALPEWTAVQYKWSNFIGGKVSDQLADGADGDSNFLFNGVTADYNVTVSLTEKIITLEQAGPPAPPTSIFLVVAQTFDLNTAIELKGTTPGLYEGNATLEKNTLFRFFSSREWKATKWSWSFFDGGTVDTDLIDNGDDLSNFRLKSESGYFKIAVSIDNKTIVVTPISAQTLYILGDVQGWTPSNALQMRSIGINKFEAIGTFQLDKIFRFFITPAFSKPNNEMGWSSFAGGVIDSDLADGGGGDSNIKFASANGVYKITVSINDKTITVDPVPTPTLYIIGTDQNNWDNGSAYSLTWLGGGKYQGTTTFTNNSTFRLFIKPLWVQPNNELGWSYFSSGTIDSDLEDGGPPDSNFKFTGTTGSHIFTVNTYSLTVDIE